MTIKVVYVESYYIRNIFNQMDKYLNKIDPIGQYFDPNVCLKGLA